MSATGVNDAREAMAQCASALLQEAEVSQLPVTLELVASFQRVRAVEQVAMAQAGRLVPDGNNFIVQVNKSHSLGKRNFTLSHEVGHTILFNYEGGPQLVEDFTTGQYDQGQEEEYLCDVAAAELLMPMRMFKPLAVASGFNLATVADFAKTFRASREAVAIRLVQADLWPCAIAVWHHAHKPSQKSLVSQPTFAGMEWAVPEKELRVRYAVHSSSFSHFLHKHLRAEKDGCLASCFRDGGVVSGEEQLEIRGRLVKFQVIAGAIDFSNEDGKSREILSLLMAEGCATPSPGGQSDFWSQMIE